MREGGREGGREGASERERRKSDSHQDSGSPDSTSDVIDTRLLSAGQCVVTFAPCNLGVESHNIIR